MALADIINKIGADAAEQAAGIVAEATRRAERTVSAAAATAERQRSAILDDADERSRKEAETIVVKARLAARDALVEARRAEIAETLAQVSFALAGLPDDRYTPWLAARIVEAARGGETLALGSGDTGRERAIRDEIARIAPDLSLGTSGTPAPFERGALLTGDRVRADLSLEAIVADRTDELELVAARALFSGEA